MQKFEWLSDIRAVLRPFIFVTARCKYGYNELKLYRPRASLIPWCDRMTWSELNTFLVHFDFRCLLRCLMVEGLCIADDRLIIHETRVLFYSII